MYSRFMAFGYLQHPPTEDTAPVHIRRWENVQQKSIKESGPCSMLHSHMYVAFSRGCRQQVCARDELLVVLSGQQGCALGHWGKS